MKPLGLCITQHPITNMHSHLKLPRIFSQIQRQQEVVQQFLKKFQTLYPDHF